jgi:hypothetical protein
LKEAMDCLKKEQAIMMPEITACLISDKLHPYSARETNLSI